MANGRASARSAGEDPGCPFLKLDRLTLRWPDRSPLLAAISHAIDAVIRVTPTLGVASSMFVSKLAADPATVGFPVILEQEKPRAYRALGDYGTSGRRVVCRQL